MAEIIKDKKNIWLLAGMAIGVIAIIVGLVFIGSHNSDVFYGSPDSSYGGTTRLGTATFGADFYTEIYKSTTFAGNAAAALSGLISTCFGLLFLFLGAIDVCVFGRMLPWEKLKMPNIPKPGAKEASAETAAEPVVTDIPTPVEPAPVEPVQDTSVEP